MSRPAVPRHPSSSNWTSSSQVAFRLDFEFSKSIFLHHLEIRLTAGRSGPRLLLPTPSGLCSLLSPALLLATALPCAPVPTWGGPPAALSILGQLREK